MCVSVMALLLAAALLLSLQPAAALAKYVPLKNTTYATCNTGNSRLLLGNLQKLPGQCKPSHAAVGTAVLNCFLTSKVTVADCAVLIKPKTKDNKLAPVCDVLHARGQLTGATTANVVGILSQEKFSRYIAENPEDLLGTSALQLKHQLLSSLELLFGNAVVYSSKLNCLTQVPSGKGRRSGSHRNHKSSPQPTQQQHANSAAAVAGGAAAAAPMPINVIDGNATATGGSAADPAAAAAATAADSAAAAAAAPSAPAVQEPAADAATNTTAALLPTPGTGTAAAAAAASSTPHTNSTAHANGNSTTSATARRDRGGSSSSRTHSSSSSSSGPVGSTSAGQPAAANTTTGPGGDRKLLLLQVGHWLLQQQHWQQQGRRVLVSGEQDIAGNAESQDSNSADVTMKFSGNPRNEHDQGDFKQGSENGRDSQIEQGSELNRMALHGDDGISANGGLGGVEWAAAGQVDGSKAAAGNKGSSSSSRVTITSPAQSLPLPSDSADDAGGAGRVIKAVSCAEQAAQEEHQLALQVIAAGSTAGETTGSTTGGTSAERAAATLYSQGTALVLQPHANCQYQFLITKNPRVMQPEGKVPSDILAVSGQPGRHGGISSAGWQGKVSEWSWVGFTVVSVLTAFAVVYMAVKIVAHKREQKYVALRSSEGQPPPISQTTPVSIAAAGTAAAAAQMEQQDDTASAVVSFEVEQVVGAKHRPGEEGHASGKDGGKAGNATAAVAAAEHDVAGAQNDGSDTRQLLAGYVSSSSAGVGQH